MEEIAASRCGSCGRVATHICGFQDAGSFVSEPVAIRQARASDYARPARLQSVADLRAADLVLVEELLIEPPRQEIRVDTSRLGPYKFSFVAGGSRNLERERGSNFDLHVVKSLRWSFWYGQPEHDLQGECLQLERSFLIGIGDSFTGSRNRRLVHVGPAEQNLCRGRSRRHSERPSHFPSA
jgi:hypothetical protein